MSQPHRRPWNQLKALRDFVVCCFAQTLQTPDVKVDINNFYISVHVNICCSVSSYCPKAEGNMWFASNLHTLMHTLYASYSVTAVDAEEVASWFLSTRPGSGI